MNCPYCGLSSDVEVVGIPTESLLVSLAPALGFGILTTAAAAALVAAYRLTGKRIFKCTRCDKYFIA